MSIFCDGSCRGNGKKSAIAGWAWAYWVGTVSGSPTAARAAPLHGLATNQRAELTALHEALQWWSTTGGGGPIDIYTDSQYAINCTSKWGPAWRKAGWKRASGEPLQNLDIIQPLVGLWKPQWRLHHVYGHQTAVTPQAYGNNWVDRAAVEGAAGTYLVHPSSSSDLPIPAPAPPIAPKPSRTPTTQTSTPSVAPPTMARQSDIRSWFG